nr:zinc finger protein 271-like [Lytechinus pictus]
MGDKRPSYVIDLTTDWSTQLLSARPTRSPIAGNANSPVPIEVREPDFNKAIASVIWLRHYRQPTSRVFNCLVSNCPLCPASSLTERSFSAKLRSVPQPRWRSTSEINQPKVVNWLIPSSTPSSSSMSHRKRPSSRTSSPPKKRLARSLPSSLDHRPVTPESLRFCCPFCPMSFVKKDDFTIHRRFHLGTDVYYCQYCQKPFDSPARLVKHRRVHTLGQPFRCPFKGCPSEFTQQRSLDRHISQHHRNE